MNALIRVWLTALAALMLAIPCAHALDLNNASVADLQQVKGVGPVIAKRISAERRKGKFASLADLQERVPGVGPQLAENLSKGSGLPKGRASQSAVRKSSPTAKGVVIEVASVAKPARSGSITSSKTKSGKSKAKSGPGRKSAPKTAKASGKKSARTVSDKKTK